MLESRHPADAICQAAERLGADMICLGTHGRTGVAKAVLGSKGTWGFLMRKVQEQVNKMKAPEAKRPVGP